MTAQFTLLSYGNWWELSGVGQYHLSDVSYVMC